MIHFPLVILFFEFISCFVRSKKKKSEHDCNYENRDKPLLIRAPIPISHSGGRNGPASRLFDTQNFFFPRQKITSGTRLMRINELATVAVLGEPASASETPKESCRADSPSLERHGRSRLIAAPLTQLYTRRNCDRRFLSLFARRPFSIKKVSIRTALNYPSTRAALLLFHTLWDKILYDTSAINHF